MGKKKASHYRRHDRVSKETNPAGTQLTVESSYYQDSPTPARLWLIETSKDDPSEEESSIEFRLTREDLKVLGDFCWYVLFNTENEDAS